MASRRLDAALRPFADARTGLSADRIAAVRDSVNGRRRETVATLDTLGVDVVVTQAAKCGAQGRSSSSS
jgi:acetyl esterase